MKLIYVHGCMPYFEKEDNIIKDKVKGVFLELEADVTEIDLGKIHPPFFDGETTRSVDGIIDKINSAGGVVVAARTNLLMPSAVLLNFFEYFSLPEYKGILSGKHVMLVLFSANGGEKSSLNLLANIVSHLGGYVVSQIGLQSVHLADSTGQTDEFLGKVCEDFYRAVRQKRSYIIPQDFAGQTVVQYIDSSSTKQAAKELFSREEEQSIEELSRLFSKKFGEHDDLPVITKQTEALPINKKEPPLGFVNQASKLNSTVRNETPIQTTIQADTPPILPSEVIQIRRPILSSDSETAAPIVRAKTARQITQSLPHYFQPHLSAGLRAVIQINIFGNEEFTGFLNIHSTECTFTEGPAPSPDIVIMADSNMWLDVLGGKFTAQKAFMVGGLKVRGDFVLLSKFDNLFKL